MSRKQRRVIGLVARYESPIFPFAISYPAGYDAESGVEWCQTYTRCFVAPGQQAIIGILEYELAELDGRPVTLEDVRLELEASSVDRGLLLIGHDEIISQANTPATISTFEVPTTDTRFKVFTYILEPNLFFRVVFLYRTSDYHEEMTDYLISTFEVTQ